MVLQNMDTQFSKWSYDLKEGYTAIPFVTARVPPELHRKMVENDKKYWVSSIDELAGEQTDSQDIVKPTLEGHRNLRRVNTDILLTLVAQVMGEERVIWKVIVQICCNTDGIPCWNTARREMLLAGSKLGLDVDIETAYLREAESPDKPISNDDAFVEAIEYLTSRQYASATIVASAEVAKAATSEPVDDAASKRAAFIAKSRAAKNSSLVVSKSAGQKRSALQKNKNRKPIMSSPPPTPRKQEPTTKPAQGPEQQPTQQPQSRPAFIYLNSNAQDERHEVDTALQKQSIDFENGPEMEKWMHHLSRMKKARDEGRVLDEVEAPSAADGSQGGGDQGQGSKLAGRLKGKARKTAKGDSTC
ncbi:hypothetical protein E8E13_007695 [Curvularia kusanoi]|uniref:Uncharacterized protein n=1 Tax=Curvularia kusanoi TaxID=90978 RepID=A0A9P4WAB2_CURKU|nr:hypothetical protein E8E13_007695 [Curvularia kusanoi]